MERVTFPRKNISENTINEITGILKEKCNSSWRNPVVKKKVWIENLMARAYVQNPSQRYSECRNCIQPFCREYRLDDTTINKIATGIRLTEFGVREELADWAYEIAGLIYAGMDGDNKAIKTAKEKMSKPYLPKYDRKHISQGRMILFSLFEFVPELKQNEVYSKITNIGNDFINILLNKIVNALISDTDTEAYADMTQSIDELKREVFLARNELAEYKALVEAEDAEYDDKIAQLTQLEITSFFSALNDEKYGFLIDTAYLLNRACVQVKKSNTELPFQVQGFPAMIDRLLRFFKDAGIAPVSKFAPHSEQKLTLKQMDGCIFEPAATRKKSIGENELVTVKVLSSGWKYKDNIISCPVLHEIENN